MAASKDASGDAARPCFTAHSAANIALSAWNPVWASSTLGVLRAVSAGDATGAFVSVTKKPGTLVTGAVPSPATASPFAQELKLCAQELKLSARAPPSASMRPGY